MCTFSQFSEMNFTQGIDFLPPADWLCEKPSLHKVGELICLLRLQGLSSLTSQVDMINYQLAVQWIKRCTNQFSCKKKEVGGGFAKLKFLFVLPSHEEAKVSILLSSA